ncbi:hypothetical protein [Kaarinaea lacus]
MGAIEFLFFLLGLGMIAFLAFYPEYKRLVRRHKPEYFGQDTFQQVTCWQSSEWQFNAKRKGITLAEWHRLCEEQLNWVNTALRG